MMNKIALIFLACLFPFLVIAQPLTPNEQKAVDDLFREWDDPASPGCAIGIVRKGELVYSKGYGSANLDWQLPLAPDSRFYIPSTTKQFTAACVALLALDGKLILDDDIRKYFPELPDYGHTITVRHLVHHTSGIRDYLTLTSIAGRSFEDYTDNAQAIELIARQRKLNFEPGTRYMYSNSGYVLLADLVRRVSGKTIREYAEEKFFAPLDMTHTFFNDNHHQVIPKRVVSYRPAGEKEFRRFVQNFDALGDGNMISSVEDLYRWDQNFYSGKVGGQAFLDLMHTRGVLNDGKEMDYAFGLTLGNYKGAPTVSHGGSMLGFRTQLLRFPEQEFSVIVLANVAGFNPNRACYRIADMFLRFPDAPESPAQERPGRKPRIIQVASDRLQALTGWYDNPKNPGPLEVRLEDEQLTARQSWSGESYPLLATSDSTFFQKGNPEVRYNFGDRLTVRAGDDTYLLDRFEHQPPPDDFRAYSGVFYSPELDARMEIRVRDGRLYRIRNETQAIPLLLISKDLALLPNGNGRCIFEFAPTGEVIRSRITAGRVQDLEFYRMPGQD